MCAEKIVPGKLVERKSAASRLSYLLYVPHTHETANRSWPVVVFLHGAGETGRDVWQLLAEGATGAIPELCKNQTGPKVLTDNFICVSPQTPSGWDHEAHRGSLGLLIDELVADARLGVDARRVYLTGLSMGGAGTVSVAAAHPDKFAAAVPVCGWGDAAAAQTVARNMPVWVFHGANDVIVGVEGSRSMVKAARAVQGAIEVKYTEYPDAPAPVGYKSFVGHASWIPAYQDESLWNWLLSKSR